MKIKQRFKILFNLFSYISDIQEELRVQKLEVKKLQNELDFIKKSHKENSSKMTKNYKNIKKKASKTYVGVVMDGVSDNKKLIKALLEDRDLTNQRIDNIVANATQ